VIGRPGKPHVSTEIEAENGTGRREAPPTGEAALPLVSSSSAPSCRQLLGDGLVERNAPHAAQRETRLANRELLRGNVTEAQAAYCKALAWDRPNVDRHVNLGRLFLVRRDWKKAAEYGHGALALDPKNRRALGVVGDALAALHETDEAREAWLAVEKKSDANAKELALIVRRNMALAQRVERLKDFSLAERIYRRVLLFSPAHAGATKGIASCLVKLGDHSAAEAWTRRAEALGQSKRRSRRDG
jgi:tetratricopeptide (TPR) repeat protein